MTIMRENAFWTPNYTLFNIKAQNTIRMHDFRHRADRGSFYENRVGIATGYNAGNKEIVLL